MKRAVWILKSKLAARAGWITESSKGVYFGHLGDLPKMKYSYHTKGRKHVTLPNGDYFPPLGTLDTPLDDVDSRKAIGGFSIDPSKLDWAQSGKFGAANLVFNIAVEARDDMPFIVSAFIFPNAEAARFAGDAHSAGAAYKDSCVSLPLTEFSHLTCVVLLQYLV